MFWESRWRWLEPGTRWAQEDEMLSCGTSADSGEIGSPVDLRFPKFEFRTQAGLLPALVALGLSEAVYPSRAYFSGMTSEEKLFIAAVIHEAFIAVDEEGTEAAAATAVVTAASAAPSEPVQLTVDRPFMFQIKDARCSGAARIERPAMGASWVARRCGGDFGLWSRGDRVRTLESLLRRCEARSAVAVAMLLLGAVACASCGGSGYEYAPPAAEGDGWSVGSAAEVGFDLQMLGEMVDHVRDRSDCAVHGILIVKDDMLVFEEYLDGHRFDYDDPEFRGEPVAFDSTVRHTLMSVTKAVPAALVGIAIDDGLIRGVDEPVLAAFPEYEHVVRAGADEITVEHLLTMTSGLEWNEWDVPLTDTANDLIQLFIVSDPIEYILTKPVTHEPGTYWYYSGGDVNLLGEYFEAVTGVAIDDFSVSHLFEPLGISDYQWQYLTSDVVYVSGELELRPRDMAKFGFLYLNDGVWNGTQVIPPDWVEASLAEHVAIPGRTGDGDGYAYQWFTRTYQHGGVAIEAVQRTGWGGQALVLFPTLDMMVALTGGDYLLQCQFDELLTDYIIPALEPAPVESAS